MGSLSLLQGASQGCWGGQPFRSPGDLPNQGGEPRSPSVQADSVPAEPPGKPKNTGVGTLSLLQRIFLTQELNRGLLQCRWILYQLSYQGRSAVKNSPANAGEKRDLGSISGLGRSPGGEHSNPLQCSCLENPRERGAWQLQSVGSQRVRHDGIDLAHTHLLYPFVC